MLPLTVTGTTRFSEVRSSSMNTTELPAGAGLVTAKPNPVRQYTVECCRTERTGGRKVGVGGGGWGDEGG